MLSSSVGGWGKRVCKDRAPQPGGRFVLSLRACAQCCSCQIRNEMGGLPPFLFPLVSLVIFLFHAGLVSLS